MGGRSDGRRHQEVKRVNDEEQANQLLAKGWDLFTVISGGGEIHYILTRRRA